MISRSSLFNKNNKQFYFVFLVISLLGLPFACYGEIYRWYDEKGNVHFGDKEKNDLDQQVVELDIPISEWERFVIEINDVDNILTDQEKGRIDDDVRAVYRFFDRKLYFDIYKTVPVKIRLYKKRADYIAYLNGLGSRHASNSRGIYFPTTNEIVVYMNENKPQQTFWTIKHEVSHAVVDTLTPFVPAWLNEGIAENAEVLEWGENGFILALHEENYMSARSTHGSGHYLDVNQLLSVRSSDYYDQIKRGQNLTQAYAGEIVRMLLSTKTGQNFIVRLVHVYERGDRTFSTHIVDKYYIGGLKVLQDQWNNWVVRPEGKELSL